MCGGSEPTHGCTNAESNSETESQYLKTKMARREYTNNGHENEEVDTLNTLEMFNIQTFEHT